VFRQHHKLSPVEFRRGIPTEQVQHPFVQEHITRFQSFREYDEKITIQKFEDFTVIYERYIGNYTELEANWAGFTEKYKDYFTDEALLIERSYDDPAITSIGQCLYDICMTVGEGCPLENVMNIHGGKFAVYRFDGFVEDIFAAFQGIFNVWLPASKYEMDQRYGLDIYRAVDCDTHHVVMDLCVPVK
jgi:AraC family transcriptional regulator